MTAVVQNIKLMKGHFLHTSRVDFNFSSVTWQECSREIKTIVSRITDKLQSREKVIGPFLVKRILHFNRQILRF